jgi:hypothetical protein
MLFQSLKTSKSGSGVPSQDLDVVPEQRDSVSRESMSSDDNDDIKRLPDDSDSESDSNSMTN